MITKLTEEQLGHYKDVFLQFDENDDGFISVSELGNMMRGLGENPTDALLQDMINEIDVNGNGVIDFDEFVTIMGSKEDDPAEQIRDAFSVFDKDHDGFISIAELCHTMNAMGERFSYKEIEDILHEVDGDNDGKINYEEFEVLMT